MVKELTKERSIIENYLNYFDQNQMLPTILGTGSNLSILKHSQLKQAMTLTGALILKDTHYFMQPFTKT